jgi:hypothetical protein
MYYKHPLWELSELEAKLATRETSSKSARAKEDAAFIQNILENFGSNEFSAYEVRAHLGIGQPRADRLVSVGIQSKAFESAGERVHNKKTVPTYKARTVARTVKNAGRTSDVL